MVFLTTGVTIPLYCSILDVVQDSREDKDSLLTCYAALQSSGLSIYSHGISHLPQLHCMTITHFTSLSDHNTNNMGWSSSSSQPALPHHPPPSFKYLQPEMAAQKGFLLPVAL